MFPIFERETVRARRRIGNGDHCHQCVALKGGKNSAGPNFKKAIIRIMTKKGVENMKRRGEGFKSLLVWNDRESSSRCWNF